MYEERKYEVRWLVDPCLQGQQRVLMWETEEASMEDSAEEELRCLRAQQRIDSMRDLEAKALAQASECQRQLKRQIEIGGC